MLFNGGSVAVAELVASSDCSGGMSTPYILVSRNAATGSVRLPFCAWIDRFSLWLQKEGMYCFFRLRVLSMLSSKEERRVSRSGVENK